MHLTRDLCYAAFGWARESNVPPFLERAVERFGPPPGTSLRARLRRRLRHVWFPALLVGIYLLYRFVGSAGLEQWPIYGVYHDLQADGFLKGHLHLPIEPAPELLRAKNPYDYSNSRYWWLDATYWKGKYYIYWGPVPALFDAAGKWLLGIRRGIGDQYVCFFFHCLAYLCGAFIVERMLRRLFGYNSRLLVALGTLAVACANPTLHGVATLSTYQTAIIAAQAWLLAGLLLASDAVWHAGTGRARVARLLFAGTCFGLALGSRVSVMPAIAALIVLTALAEAWPSAKRWRRFVTNGLALGLPVCAAGCGLLCFNKLRFGEFLQFGSNIQLSAYPLGFAPRWLPGNVYSYSLRLPRFSCEFPYVHQIWNEGRGAFPKWFPLPPDYQIVEPTVGWAISTPLTWLAPFALVLAPFRAGFSNRRARMQLFCLFSFATLASLSGVLTLFIYGSTMRYLNDIAFGLVLLSLLGAFSLRHHRWASAAPRTFSAIVAAASIVTIVMGLLLGYQGYNFHFQRFNPALDAKIANTLSFCGPYFRRSKTPGWGQ
jgi:hypothetical protein